MKKILLALLILSTTIFGQYYTDPTAHTDVAYNNDTLPKGILSVKFSDMNTEFISNIIISKKGKYTMNSGMYFRCDYKSLSELSSTIYLVCLNDNKEIINSFEFSNDQKNRITNDEGYFIVGSSNIDTVKLYNILDAMGKAEYFRYMVYSDTSDSTYASLDYALPWSYQVINTAREQMSDWKNETVQDSDTMYFLDTLDMEYYEEDRD